MRILILTYEFPPVGGGGGRAARDICEKLVARGHEVLVLTSHLKGLPRSEPLLLRTDLVLQPSSSTEPGIASHSTLAMTQADVIASEAKQSPPITHDTSRINQQSTILRVPSLRRKAFVATFYDMGAYVVSAIWAGLRIVPRWKPDVMQVHFAVPTGPAGWALARLYHLPYVLTAHLGDVPGGVPEKTGRWFRLVYPFTHPIWKAAARVVAVSEHTRQLASQHYPVDIQVIPNGVDTQALNPGLIEPHDPPQIIFAARFMPQKNPLQIVRVLAGLRELPWKCLMFGDGPLRSQVAEAIEREGLQSRISLPGWVNPEQVLAHYAQSDVLFMPSLSEGFPLTGVQGLAMGLAIVASRIGGFADLVHPGENGYLYEPDDTPGMQAGLRTLLTDPQLLQQMRTNSRRLSQHFDLNNVVDAYEAIFQDVVSQKGARVNL